MRSFSRLASLLAQYVRPAAIFTASRLLVFLVATIVPKYSILAWPLRWNVWDGAHYLSIAAHGYTFGGAGPAGNTVAFFPLYPLSIWLASLGGLIDQYHVALLLSFIVGLCAACALYAYARPLVGEESALLSVLLLSFSPASVFLSAPYAEGMLLVLVILFLIASSRGQWVLAGLFAGLACVTKPLGFGLLPVLVWVLVRHAVKLRTSAISLALAVAPCVIFGIFLQLRFGNALAFVTAEKAGWGRTLAWPWTGLGHLLTSGFVMDRADLLAVLTVAILLVVAWKQKMPREAILFGAWLLLLAVSSVITVSTGRYLLTAVPAYLATAELMKSRMILQQVVLAFLAAATAIATLVFLSHGAFL